MALRSILVCVGLAAGGLFCAAAIAQTRADEAADPPARVARLSYLDGDAGLLPAGASDWGQADLNRPLTRGDRLATEDDARAELDFGGAALRLDGGTDAGLLELDDPLAQIELTQGTLELSVRTLAEGQSYEIDTPTVAVVVDRPAELRVDIGADGRDTRISVFDGRATVYGEDDARREVVAGRRYRFANATLDTVALEDLDEGDRFDDWWRGRERHYAEVTSDRYVDEEVVGAEDLDRYGSWQATADYGNVWYPADVGPDWAPYRDGRWVWVDPWGWTWVDAAPWGFAPYHYGRWAWIDERWGWVPGPLGVRPIYAPALVVFIGGGAWSASYRAGAPIGWLPLGPGEIYHPWYRYSHDYYRRVNWANLHHDPLVRQRLDHEYFEHHRQVPVRAEHYRNVRGLTAVPARAFEGAERVRAHRLRVDPARLREAPVVARPHPGRPLARTRVTPRPPRARPLPVAAFDRAVVARHAPPVRRVEVRGTHIEATAPRTALPAHVRVLGRTPPAAPRPRQLQDDRRPTPRGHAADARARPERVPVLRRAGPEALPSARYARTPHAARDRPAPALVNRLPRPAPALAPRAAPERPAGLPRVTRLHAAPAPVERRLPVREAAPRGLPRAPRLEPQASPTPRAMVEPGPRPAPMRAPAPAPRFRAPDAPVYRAPPAPRAAPVARPPPSPARSEGKAVIRAAHRGGGRQDDQH